MTPSGFVADEFDLEYLVTALPWTEVQILGASHYLTLNVLLIDGILVCVQGFLHLNLGQSNPATESRASEIISMPWVGCQVSKALAEAVFAKDMLTFSQHFDLGEIRIKLVETELAHERLHLQGLIKPAILVVVADFDLILDGIKVLEHVFAVVVLVFFVDDIKDLFFLFGVV